MNTSSPVSDSQKLKALNFPLETAIAFSPNPCLPHVSSHVRKIFFETLSNQFATNDNIKSYIPQPLLKNLPLHDLLRYDLFDPKNHILNSVVIERMKEIETMVVIKTTAAVWNHCRFSSETSKHRINSPFHLEDALIHFVDEENRNLILVFPKILAQIPAGTPGPVLTGTPADQASQIRTWMNSNKTILATITFLNLRGLGLTLLPNEIFGLLPKLSRLDAPNNQISRIPAEIGSLLNLKILDVRNNLISSIAEIELLLNLTLLNVCNNRISSIAEIGWHPYLQQLEASHNQISIIPAEIGSLLPNLKILDVSNNRISSIPAESIRLCGKLIYLNVSNNLISSIAEIGSLLYLEQLDVSHNQISIIPAKIGLLLYLEQLDASHNQISIIPDKIKSCGKLHRLNVSHNQISSIAEIGSLPYLEHLDVSNNQISSIPAESTRLCGMLRSLDASNNRISSITAKIGWLYYLEYLNVQNNQLSSNQLSSLTVEIGSCGRLKTFQV